MGVESIFCVNLLVDITVVVDIPSKARHDGRSKRGLVVLFFPWKSRKGYLLHMYFFIGSSDGNTYSHYRIFLFYFFFFRHLFDGFVRVVVVGTSLIGVIFS